MTDEELIARLRKFGELWPDDHAAADRIEALVKERDKAALWATEQHASADSYALRLGQEKARAEAAEAKAARLEAALDVDPWFLGWGAWQYHVRKARAAIAEVQTNRTTTPTEYERKVAQMKEDFPNGI